MRLHWFSPLPPMRSGIAEYAAELLPALAERCEVVLWTPHETWDAELERHARVRRLAGGELPWAEINRADATVYHLGNHPTFHGAIWRVSRLHPGVVVLHDLRLHHLFAGLAEEHWTGAQGYLEQMALRHGDAGRRAAEQARRSPNGVEPLAERYPLTELAVEGALGVLVHSDRALAEVAPAVHGPVARAPLPVRAGPSRRRPRQEGPLRLLAAGHFGFNRRLPQLLEALAGLAPERRFRLDVFGEIEDPGRVRALVHELEMGDRVVLHGHVSSKRLARAMDEADLAVNLRFPTMGEASLTQLVLWRHALPTIVTRVGWYAELPDDVVAFVDPEREVEDLRRHLREALADRDSFRAMGERARRFLEERHAPEPYVETLLELCRSTLDRRAEAALPLVSARVAEGIEGWGREADAAGWIESCAARIHGLLGAAAAGPDRPR